MNRNKVGKIQTILRFFIYIGAWRGRSDVVVYDPINARVAIFEAKYTKTLGNLEKDCDTALQQIDDRMYAKEYEDDYDQILCYGISFFKKTLHGKGKIKIVI